MLAISAACSASMINLSMFTPSETAKDALGALPRLKPKLIFVDVNLPDGNGIDAMAELVPRMPETLFVVLTSVDDGDQLFKALQIGAVGYLLKRDGPAEILRLLETVLDGGSPMSSGIARRVARHFQFKANAIEDFQLTEREVQVVRTLQNWKSEHSDSKGVRRHA